MNYELAKKLKDAGFPHNWAKDFESLLPNHPEDCKCLPTLSELIEACGGILLWGCESHGYYASKQFCPTENKTIESIIEADAEGKTPEEAVANLWLELNPKSKI